MHISHFQHHYCVLGRICSDRLPRNPSASPSTRDQPQDHVRCMRVSVNMRGKVQRTPTVVKLRASPEVKTTPKMIGDRMMNLRPENAPDEDLATSVAEMSIKIVSFCLIQVASESSRVTPWRTALHILSAFFQIPRFRHVLQYGCIQSSSELEYCNLGIVANLPSSAVASVLSSPRKRASAFRLVR